MSQLTPNEEATKAAYDQLAGEWATNHNTRGFWADELALFHKLLPAGRILEVGAGGGRDAAELLELGYDYVGTDVSPGLIEQARLQNPGVDFREVSVYDLDFDEKFDGFWCSAMLLHIPKDRIGVALNAIRRNVKDQGVGFISIKEGDSEGMETGDVFTDAERLFSYWKNEDFTAALSKDGFSIEHQGYRPMSERTKWLTYIVRVNDGE